MSVKRDLEFLYEIGCLRFLQRNWKQFLNPDFANITEHIFRVTWIALTLAKHEGTTDTAKVMKMALVHDITESRSGDLQYLSRQYSTRNEEKAIEDMLADTALAPDFISVWKEYEKRESLEAKIVKDADNLDVEFELKEQEVSGHELRKLWLPVRRHVVQNHLYTRSAKAMWKAIQESKPHDWHVNAPNRFAAGDWKK